jgi:hypothetical protein
MVQIVVMEAAAVRAGGSAAVRAVRALADLDTAHDVPLPVVVADRAAAEPEQFLRHALAGADPARAVLVTDDGELADQARSLDVAVVLIGVDVADWAGMPDAVRHRMDPDDVEGATFERSLRAHGHLADPAAGTETSCPSVTHHLEPGPGGRRVLRRDRFHPF